MDRSWHHARGLGFCFAFLLVVGSPAAAQNAVSAGEASLPSATENALQIDSGTLLYVELPKSTNWKRMEKGSIVEGRLLLPVYAGQQMAIPAETKLRLTIESSKKASDGAGRWRKLGNAMDRAFNPLDTGKPAEYTVKVGKVEILSPQHTTEITEVTALRAGRTRVIEPQPHSHEAANAGRPARKKESKHTILLRVDEQLSWVAPDASRTSDDFQLDTTEEKRTHAFLLTSLSASHSRKEERFEAQLAEPVRLGDRVFEAGSRVQGKVVRSNPPRILSRAGSLYLQVDHIVSPQGDGLPVSAVLSGADAGAGSRTVLDAEGGLRGLKPGLKTAIVDLSVAYAIGKVTDDIAETPIRAVGAVMSDAAVANVARYFGLGASVAFLVTRHGRDVCLPKYGEIQLDFGRLPRETSEHIIGNP